MSKTVKIQLVKKYPENKENFILCVDFFYHNLSGQRDFFEKCSEILREWGIEILNPDIGLVNTPYGKSGLNLCFSTSQKAVLVAEFIKYKFPEQLYYLNMTEVAEDMYERLFLSVADYPHIVLVTKVLLGDCKFSDVTLDIEAMGV